MIKNLLHLLFIILLITSCKKITGPLVPSKPKQVSNLTIATELPLQGKGQGFFVGVQYSKDYTDADQVNLTLNGQPGSIVHTRYADMAGWQVLFKFPPVNQTGTYKLKATVKNSQNSADKQIDYKIVEDLGIKSVWENLNKNYYYNVEYDLLRNINGEFTIKPRSVVNEAGGVNININGKFTDDSTPNNPFVAPRNFIPGLEGEYYLTFNGDILKELRVVHGVKADLSFTSGKFYKELEAAFGKPTKGLDAYKQSVNIYNYSEFTISGYDDIQVMYTVIQKK